MGSTADDGGMTTPRLTDPLVVPLTFDGAGLLRVIAGLGGVGLLLFSALFTLGASLAAPFGIFLGRQVARRKGRAFTGLGAWLWAVAASTIAVLVAVAILISLIPPGEWQEVQRAIAQAQVEGPQPDSVTAQVVQAPGFIIATGVIGGVIACAIFGAFAGTSGWLSTLMLSHALRGRRAT